MLFGASCKFSYLFLRYQLTNLTRLPTATSMTANQSQIFSQALDFYLQEGAKFDTYRQELYTLSQQNTKEADNKILK